MLEASISNKQSKVFFTVHDVQYFRCRRNQPNTVHSGLKGPMLRRATTMAAADDKVYLINSYIIVIFIIILIIWNALSLFPQENARALIRVKALRREEEEMEEDEFYGEVYCIRLINI